MLVVDLGAYPLHRAFRTLPCDQSSFSRQKLACFVRMTAEGILPAHSQLISVTLTQWNKLLAVECQQYTSGSDGVWAVPGLDSLFSGGLALNGTSPTPDYAGAEDMTAGGEIVGKS